MLKPTVIFPTFAHGFRIGRRATGARTWRKAIGSGSARKSRSSTSIRKSRNGSPLTKPLAQTSHRFPFLVKLNTEAKFVLSFRLRHDCGVRGEQGEPCPFHYKAPSAKDAIRASSWLERPVRTSRSVEALCIFASGSDPGSRWWHGVSVAVKSGAGLLFKPTNTSLKAEAKVGNLSYFSKNFSFLADNGKKTEADQYFANLSLDAEVPS